MTTEDVPTAEHIGGGVKLEEIQVKEADGLWIVEAEGASRPNALVG